MPKGRTGTNQTKRSWRGKPCQILGCREPNYGHGLCKLHYQHIRDGSPLWADNGPGENISVVVTYKAAHSRVKRLWGRATQYQCIACDKPAKQWAYDGTDPNQLYGPGWSNGGWLYYSTFPEFYMPMCTRCHKLKDGAATAQELYEYRLWRQRTGRSLNDPDVCRAIDLVDWENLNEILDADESGLSHPDFMYGIGHEARLIAEMYASRVGSDPPRRFPKEDKLESVA